MLSIWLWTWETRFLKEQILISRLKVEMDRNLLLLVCHIIIFKKSFVLRAIYRRVWNGFTLKMEKRRLDHVRVFWTWLHQRSLGVHCLPLLLGQSEPLLRSALEFILPEVCLQLDLQQALYTCRLKPHSWSVPFPLPHSPCLVTSIIILSVILEKNVVMVSSLILPNQSNLPI